MPSTPGNSQALNWDILYFMLLQHMEKRQLIIAASSWSRSDSPNARAYTTQGHRTWDGNGCSGICSLILELFAEEVFGFLFSLVWLLFAFQGGAFCGFFFFFVSFVFCLGGFGFEMGSHYGVALLVSNSKRSVSSESFLIWLLIYLYHSSTCFSHFMKEKNPNSY